MPDPPANNIDKDRQIISTKIGLHLVIRRNWNWAHVCPHSLNLRLFPTDEIIMAKPRNIKCSVHHSRRSLDLFCLQIHVRSPESFKLFLPSVLSALECIGSGSNRYQDDLGSGICQCGSCLLFTRSDNGRWP
jgi:hypothetical protein